MQPTARTLGTVVTAHVDTWRPYTSCYIGLVGLAGASLASASASGSFVTLRLAAAWGIPTLAWLAGLYGGDWFDRELDAVSKPHRPIPSGRISAGTALGTMIVLIAVSGVTSVLLQWHTLLIVAAAVVIGLSYNGFFKARGLVGNLVRGSLTGLVVVFGALLVSDRISAVVLGAAVVFALHDSASNLVGTLRDVDGDLSGGYRTFPVVHGLPAGVNVVTTLVATWTVLAFAVGLGDVGGVGLSTVVLFTAALAMAWFVVGRLISVRTHLTRRLAYRMHEVLCLERLTLAAAAIAYGGHPLLAACTWVPAVVVTGYSQTALRARHEFGVEPDTRQVAVVS
ncbi:MAG: UbiA family prenyltransferase [Jatrophihabitans sp.]